MILSTHVVNVPLDEMIILSTVCQGASIGRVNEIMFEDALRVSVDPNDTMESVFDLS